MKLEEKFDLEKVASQVYSKAEEMYKGSEINSDTLGRVIDRYFSNYSDNQIQMLKDYFKEQEQIFADMYESKQIKVENYKPTDDEWVGKMKDTNGTFFDVYQHGDKFLDVLGNELDKDEVKNFVSKNTKKESKLEESEIKNLATTFNNYKAFQNNFGDIYIVKSSYDNLYYFFRNEKDAKIGSEYFNYCDSKDYVEGWLYGAVQANNNVFGNLTKESKKLNEDKFILSTEELPEFCYTYVESDNTIGVIKKGVVGYYPSKIEVTEDMTKEDILSIIKQQNDILEVTPEQQRSMELKSMFGWQDVKTEADNIEMKTTASVLDDIKNALNKRCGDILSAETAKVDDVVGLKLTRKGKQDLVYLFDKIRDNLQAAGIDPKDYEIDLKGDSLILAMKNMTV